MTKLLLGAPVAEKVYAELKERIAKLTPQLGRTPHLSAILVGSHAPSKTYVNMKRGAAQAIGITTALHTFEATVSQQQLIESIEQQNLDDRVDGILVQFPLPDHIDTMKIIETLAPDKDVDGFHPLNMGKLLLGATDGFVPCTPLGVQRLLQGYEIETEGRHVVIVGRSLVVGKPLAALLVQNKKGADATVTLAHSHSDDLPSLTKEADILIVAAGKPHLVKAEMVKKDAVVVDVGISRIVDKTASYGYRLIGDVDFKALHSQVAAITPVPKGVGPMTVAMLLSNTVLSAERRNKR